MPFTRGFNTRVVDVAEATFARPLLPALAIALVHVAPTSDGALAGPHASPACMLVYTRIVPVRTRRILFGVY